MASKESSCLIPRSATKDKFKNIFLAKRQFSDTLPTRRVLCVGKHNHDPSENLSRTLPILVRILILPVKTFETRGACFHVRSRPTNGHVPLPIKTMWPCNLLHFLKRGAKTSMYQRSQYDCSCCQCGLRSWWCSLWITTRYRLQGAMNCS